jgi:phospholipase/carboxylesterase
MLVAPLPTVEIDPPKDPVAVVIWLHGLGADGHDFEPIVPQLSLPADLPVRFFFHMHLKYQFQSLVVSG